MRHLAPLLLALALCASNASSQTAPRASSEPAGEGVAMLIKVLAENDDPQLQLDVLKGMNAAMEGRRRVAAPAGWAAARDKLLRSGRADVRAQAQSLAVVFGDAVAFDEMRRTLADRAAPPPDRRLALQSLVAAEDAKLLPVLQDLLDDPALREPALVGLAAYDDPRTPELIVQKYEQFDLPARRAALNTLAGRVGSARALAAAVKAGKIPPKDLTAATARQLRDLDDEQVNAFVDQVWGVARNTPKDKLETIDHYKQALTEDRIRAANPSRGRATFSRVCAQCHTLYDQGGQVGPNLTGSNRFNLDYVLQNVIDPSAVIAREYQVTLIRTKDGRVVSGIATEGDHAVKVVSETGTVLVPRAEIEKMRRSDLSMMPEGLLTGLSEQDVADLVAYLRTSEQVALPEDKGTR
jgi:putative heme-binding domain-containing protein